MSAACRDGIKKKINVRIMGTDSAKNACFNSPISPNPQTPKD
jgi:hypothetical protein